MCGICGIITRNPESAAALPEMSAALRHRGPDQDGAYADSRDGVYFAHRRLSIIDLSDLGRQPMTSACGRYVVVYNGEIYNHVEVRRSLAGLGCRFRSNSDTEVLLNAYAQWGRDCLSHLNGMFAFVLYDIPQRKLFLARDRLGEKPLYYIQRPDFFAFASEVKAFRPLKRCGFAFELDEENVAGYFAHMWVPDRSGTMLRDVRRLEPGQCAEYHIDTGYFATATYWGLQATPNTEPPEFADAVRDYGRLLEDCVRLRLRADVPVAVMLSGGLDSSIIAALARKYASDLRTFTLVFDGPNSEAPFAAEVAKHIDSRHHELRLAPGNLLQSVKDSIPYYDDLTTADGGLVTTRAMCALLREQGVKVILLGEGSDEINAGYSKFLFSKLPFTFLPAFVRNAGFYYTSTRYPVFRRGFLRYASVVNGITHAFPGDALQQMTGYDIRHQLPNHLLMKVDKGTMSESVEARVPFLDHNLVEFVYSLPAEYKYKGKFFDTKAHNEKHILRAVAEKYLPQSILKRRKFGMMLPTGDVLAANREAVRAEIFSSPSNRLFEFAGKREIESLFKDTACALRKVEKDWMLWKVYLFHLWNEWLLRG